jgi:hypothetical protein
MGNELAVQRPTHPLSSDVPDIHLEDHGPKARPQELLKDGLALSAIERLEKLQAIAGAQLQHVGPLPILGIDMARDHSPNFPPTEDSAHEIAALPKTAAMVV